MDHQPGQELEQLLAGEVAARMNVVWNMLQLRRVLGHGRFKAREGMLVISREGVLVKASVRCFAFFKVALDVDLAAFGV